MSIINHFQRLFAYDEWANREVLASIQSAETTPPRSLKLMAHILSAERLWLERLREQKPSYPVWPDFSLDQCRSEAEELPGLWRKYIQQLARNGLEGTVSYKNSKGEPWTSAVRDILTHVVMHSAYHRGQIAADMRSTGNVPAYTDFIHGVRQGLVE
ncbi:MAG TPA: DinB family protein [Terriglobales bacterium]|nr:DinB family protein [Terriglobales bacterium]